ncbi:ABC transporter transmembrane domain-containing protein [Paenibacillus rhizoplanae]
MILFFNISAALVSTLQPLLFKDLFDDILPDKQIGTAAFYMLLLILIPVIYAALNSVTSYYNNELGNHLSKNLRLRLFSDVLRTRPSNVDSIGKGEIINRITLQVGMLCEIFRGRHPDVHGLECYSADRDPVDHVLDEYRAYTRGHPLIPSMYVRLQALQEQDRAPG